MEAKPAKNRRKSFRIDTHMEGYYYLNGGKGVEGTCAVVNYCHDGVGVLFKTPKNIDPGSTVVIKLALTAKAKPVTIKGKIAWIRKTKDGFMGGIQW